MNASYISAFSSMAATEIYSDIDGGTRNLLLTIDSLQMAINVYGSRRLQSITKYYMDILRSGILSQPGQVNMRSPEPKNLQPIFSETALPQKAAKPGNYTHVSADAKVEVFQEKLGLKGSKWQPARVFFFKGHGLTSKGDVKMAIEKYLNSDQTATRQDPVEMIESINYLRQLKDDKGSFKYPEFWRSENYGYIEAFIRREIKNIRKQKKTKT